MLQVLCFLQVFRGLLGSIGFLGSLCILGYTGFLGFTGFLDFTGLAGIIFLLFPALSHHIRNLQKRKEKHKCNTHLDLLAPPKVKRTYRRSVSCALPLDFPSRHRSPLPFPSSSSTRNITSAAYSTRWRVCSSRSLRIPARLPLAPFLQRQLPACSVPRGRLRNFSSEFRTLPPNFAPATQGRGSVTLQLTRNLAGKLNYSAGDQSITILFYFGYRRGQ